MARPIKAGLDYFPIDCQFDDKVEMYLIETGAVGLAVLTTIWQMIYGGSGYYITDNKDLHLLVKRRINVDINEVIACINVLIERNIFNKRLHKEHQILTSRGVQTRFYSACNRRTSIEMVAEYMLIEVNENINVVNVDNNPITASKKYTKERKGKERKVNTPVPDDFSISARVKSWAEGKGFSNLEAHLEYFVCTCRAKNYTYADHDSAFMNAIRNDWAGINKTTQESKPWEYAI